MKRVAESEKVRGALEAGRGAMVSLELCCQRKMDAPTPLQHGFGPYMPDWIQQKQVADLCKERLDAAKVDARR